MSNNINAATLSNENLFAEAKARGIEFNPDTTRQELVAKVAAHIKAEKEANTPPSNAPTVNTGDDVKDIKSKKIFYLLRSPAYIDDNPQESAKLLDSGLYEFDRVLPRIEDAAKVGKYVQKFENGLSERQLVKIAESLGMKIRDDEEVDSEVLLQKLLSPVEFRKY